MDENILSIGGAVVDIFARPQRGPLGVGQSDDAFHFLLGDKVQLREVVECYGGGAANVAVGMSRLEEKTGLLSLVGDDTWGERILKNLKHERVDCSNISVIEGEVSPFSIILLSESGERVVLHSAGVREHLCDPLFDRDAVAKCSCVILMHLAERGCDILDDLLTVLEEHPSIPFVWNPGASEIRDGCDAPVIRKLVGRCNVLHLNEEELLTLSGEHDLARGIRVLRGAGAETISVTRGREGSVAVSGKEALSCAAIPLTVVDTTGAGDAFITGFTWAHRKGEDLQECLRAGTLNSASVVQSVGTQPGLLTKMQMTHRLQQTPIALTSFPLS